MMSPLERTMDRWITINGQHYRITVTAQREVGNIAPLAFQAAERVLREEKEDKSIPFSTRVRLLALNIPNDIEIDVINFSKPQI